MISGHRMQACGRKFCTAVWKQHNSGKAGAACSLIILLERGLNHMEKR